MDKTFKMNFHYTVSFISPRIRKTIEELNESVIENIQEIRLRKGKPVVIVSKGESEFLTKNSKTTFIESNNCLIPTENEIIDTINRMCGYSMHTQTENISKGYITLNNGCRVGIAGTAVCDDGCVKTIKDISSLNIRIVRNIFNISDSIFNYFINYGLSNILIVGPPNCGKTTMLKDIEFQFSSGRMGKYYKVCVIDERNELFSNDFTGPNTDVLSGLKKEKGILIALRTLSPDIVICDEISEIDEAKKVLEGMNSGVKFVLSLHASDIEELLNKDVFKLLVNSTCINTVAILSDSNNPGVITGLYRIEGKNDEIDFVNVNSNNQYNFSLLSKKADFNAHNQNTSMRANA